jgi:1,4-alpha-glucan branching enzyme
VPEAGFYAELLNSDAAIYGGGDVGNLGGRPADAGYWWHRHPHSLSLTIPPLGMLVLKLDRGREA